MTRDPTSYPDRYNPDLLTRIPLTAHTVLDVGCYTGALGAAYKRHNPASHVFGIERDSAAAVIAATRLDDVACIDLEHDPWPFQDLQDVDCLIYGDVLEHVRDPWALLDHHARRLAPDGTILICVPNIEHWSFPARLMRGGWDYQNSGLFDATHLRWFSKASMRDGLHRLGLVVRDVTPRIFDRAAAEPFLAALAPALQTLAIDPSEYASRALPLQFIWRAQREIQPRLRVVATALAPVGGVTDLRVVYPQQALATDPSVITRIATLDDFPALADATPGIAILHRPVLRGADGLASLRRLHAGGWLSVTEFDDHPDYFPALRGDGQYSFTGVHAVQTTTEVLAETLRRRNPEVAVFPNAINVLPERRNFTDPSVLTLFFGALNRQADCHGLLPVLNHVAAVAGDKLRFRVVHDQAFFAALETPAKHFTPTCDHATYLERLGGSEISFMPLADTAFNRAKSDLKFIEAGACRVVPLASPTVYAESIEDGRTGLIFRSAEELRAKLLHLVAFPQMAQEIAEAARDHVARTRMLAGQVASRIAWYRDLWERREALSAALRARVPELGVTPGT